MTTAEARQRAERRAAPKPARTPSGGGSAYSTNRGQTFRAERRAAPKPARTPSGGGSAYSTNRGQT